MKALHLDDSVTTCDCCGRTGLKATVAMQCADGSIVYYGRTCAARNSGKDQRQIKQEIAEALAARKEQAYRELQDHPATQAYYARRIELYARYKGRLSAAEWLAAIRPERDAMEQAAVAISRRYGMPDGWLS